MKNLKDNMDRLPQPYQPLTNKRVDFHKIGGYYEVDSGSDSPLVGIGSKCVAPTEKKDVNKNMRMH